MNERRSHPYRDAEARGVVFSRRWWWAPVCALLGHRWTVARIARNANPDLAMWFLNGVDADCERCGGEHRDADRRERMEAK
jgi:hypothetical protein